LRSGLLFLDVKNEKKFLGLCPQMCDAGIENPKKNVWLNKSINPLNKTFLLGKKAINTFFTKRQNPKKNVFICGQRARNFFRDHMSNLAK